ncbi:hypothetical protein HJFPF1_04275 [Paramyrothecium foliicola]|nr:hypothetical protein HJFPF1_04275 [Paramyrothecium foliicola]
MRSLIFLPFLNVGVLAAHYPKFAATSRTPATLDRFLNTALAPRQLNCDQACADSCVPINAMCCDDVLGIYCEVGTLCTTSNTCAPDPAFGGGSGSGSGGDSGSELQRKDDSMKLCGAGCIEKDFECCDSALGWYCDAGETCISSDKCNEKPASGDASGDDSPSNDEDENPNADDKFPSGGSEDPPIENSPNNDDSSSNQNEPSGASEESQPGDDGASSNDSSTENDDKKGAASFLDRSVLVMVAGAALAFF